MCHFRKQITLIILAIVLTVSTGCGGGEVSPTAAPQPTATTKPTNTPEPTPTDTPKPTSTNTPEPTPTDTPEPTPTNTPEPTPTDTPEPTVAPSTGERRIIFASNREDPERLNLYTISPDGSNITLVPTGLNHAFHPDWSPDGNKIAFWSDDTGEELIYTTYADGSNLAQITDFSSAVPDWSPDGTRLVFQSDHRNEPKDTPDLYVIDANGENLVEILDAPDVPDYSAQWSPDGSQILFVSRRTGKDELFRMKADGTGIVQVSDSKDAVTSGIWSPDGTRIAFVYGAGPVTNLYAVDPDGISNVVRLTKDKHTNKNPAWSPDGERLVFVSNRGGNWDLWMVNADGSNLVQLTDDEFYDDFPDW
jgi:tol-pal system beta propeller repeat protein TolB